jgi:hypothetical protein
MDHEKREYILGHTLAGPGPVYGEFAGLCHKVIKLPRYDTRLSDPIKNDDLHTGPVRKP